MQFSIFVVLITTLSVVCCKDYHPHQRDNGQQRRYKDNKNKRGIGDYSGLTFGGPSFQGFQTASPAGVSFAQGFPSFGGYGSYGNYGSINSLNQNSLNLSPQSTSGFSTIGTHIVGNENLSPNSGHHLQSSGLNFASLLDSSARSQSPYLSTNTDLYSQTEKTGPVTFASHGSIATQLQPQYTPIYATGSQVGSNNYAIPVILGSLQGSNLQDYRLSPSTLNSLTSQGLSINSSPAGNGGSYNTPYLPLSGESSSQVVTGGYIMAGSTPQQSTSSSSYSIPISALSSVPSSSEYTKPIPFSPFASIFSNPSYSNSSPSSSYQLPTVSSSYLSSPSNLLGDYKKYGTASPNDNMYATSNQMRTYGATIKLENLANPSTLFGSSSNTNSGFSNSIGTNYASSPNYFNNNLKTIPSRQSNYLITSYGTPAMSYAIPSTSYGIPSNSQSNSNSNYNSQSSVSTNPSVSYIPSDVSSYSNSGNSYSSPSSNSYQTESSYRNSGLNPPSINFSKTNTNYASPSSSFSNNGNSILNYKSPSLGPTSNLSNIIENHSSLPSSHIYDTGTDTSSSFPNPSTRHLRYPASKSIHFMNKEEPIGISGYDTISYSVPNEKY